jgi:hypothetical protein
MSKHNSITRAKAQSFAGIGLDRLDYKIGKPEVPMYRNEEGNQYNTNFVTAPLIENPIKYAIGIPPIVNFYENPDGSVRTMYSTLPTFKRGDAGGLQEFIGATNSNRAMQIAAVTSRFPITKYL